MGTMKHWNAPLVAFGLVIFAALAETRSCSPTTPPVWPAQFTIHQAKWGATGNSSVVTYYDWNAQVNLLIDTPDEDQHNPLWDLELGNGINSTVSVDAVLTIVTLVRSAKFLNGQKIPANVK